MTRRDFHGTILAAAAVKNGQAQSTPEPYWYRRIRRLGQPNLNEKDAAAVNVEDWLDYWASLRMDTLVITAGGIVALYPTKVPYHRVSPFLGTRDVYGEFATGMRQRHIHLVARLDPNWNFADALAAHPEWFARDREGRAVPHNTTNELYRTCMFGHYFDEHMPAIINELADRYDTDGFYTNGWPSTGLGDICYCDACRAKYRSRFQTDLPATANRADANYRRWTEWRLERVIEIWNLWQNTSTRTRADRVFVGNLGGSIRAETNVKRIASVCQWMNADHQDRSGTTPLWDCAQQGRVCYSVMRGRTATNVTSAYNLSDAIWRHTSKAPVELRSWLSQTAASGMTPWETWLGGEPKDTRWKKPSREFFQWLAGNEKHFFNRVSLSDVALVWPQRTQVWHPRLSQNTEALQGYYYCLLENRIPFDLVHDEDLNAERLAQYRVLILPNVALLSDAACQAILDFHRNGGGIVATFETSLYDEWGNRRPDFALKDLFGAAVKGEVEGPLQNSYLRIDRNHPILNGLAGTSILPAPIFRLPVHDVTDAVLSRLPIYPAYPVEFVYPRSDKPLGPSLIAREDHGRIVYFSDDIDRTFWRTWNPDLGLLLANAVRWAARDRFAVSVRGPGLLDTFYWQTEAGLALHLVNYTTPALMKGPARFISAVGPQDVKLTLPKSFHPAQITALASNSSIPFNQSGNELLFTLPSLGEYEVVAVTT